MDSKEYEPLDESTLGVCFARAGFVIEEQEIPQMLPLANELLEMSSRLAAFVGPLAELSPIYVVDKTAAVGE